MSIYHKHHIIPRHMGGSDDPSNLIELTIEEHADAHLRLWEEHGNQYDMIAYRSLSKVVDRKEIVRQVLSETSKRSWSNPEYRKQVSQRSYYQDPEYKKRLSEAQKKVWSDPELRARQRERQINVLKNGTLKDGTQRDPKVMSDAIKNKWNDPEYRKKQSEAQKKGWIARRAKIIDQSC